MDLPPLGSKWDSVEHIKLQLYIDGVAPAIMLTTRRNDTSLLEIGCNGSGSDPGHLCPCRIALKYTATDRKYVVTERFAAHGHDLAARSKDDKEAMRRRIRSAINKIETSREGKVDAKKRRREAKARGEVTDSDASEPESTDDEESDEERAPPAWRTPAKRRDSLSGEMGDFPGRRQVTGEIEALLKKNQLLPLENVSFPSSRKLLIHLYAAVAQRGFSVYRLSPVTISDSVRLACSKHHTQQTHRPLCDCGIAASLKSNGTWTIDEATWDHTHDLSPPDVRGLIDARGRESLPPKPTTTSSRAPRSPKQPRLSDPSSNSRATPLSYRASPALSDNAPSRPPSATPALGPPPPPSPFLEPLTAFLTTLSSSLAPLAPMLLHAGITSLEQLVALLAMSNEGRDQFLHDTGLSGTVARPRVSKVEGVVMRSALRNVAKRLRSETDGEGTEQSPVFGGRGGSRSSQSTPQPAGLDRPSASRSSSAMDRVPKTEPVTQGNATGVGGGDSSRQGMMYSVKSEPC